MKLRGGKTKIEYPDSPTKDAKSKAVSCRLAKVAAFNESTSTNQWCVWKPNHVQRSDLFLFFLFQEDDLKWIEENIPASVADT